MSFHSGGVRLSDEARDDLSELSAYGFDRWGEAQSLRYFTELLETFDRIAHYPMIGERWGIEGKRLRRLPYRSHVIYYRTNEHGDGVEVLRVLHERMDEQRRLGSF